MNRNTLKRSALLLYITIAAPLACKSASSSQAAPMNTLSTAEQQAGWKLLFDGKSTAGWRNYKAQTVGPGWSVMDGILTRAADSAGDIITAERYRNFELALDWRISEGGNSGIFYRGTEDNNEIWQSAPEMQILDDARHADGQSPLTSAGSVFALYPAPRGAVHKAGAWNSARVLVNVNHVEHWLNGQKLLEYEIGSPDWVDRVEKSKFKSIPSFGKAAEGYIGLQDHGDRVEFRNIRIRVLP